MKAIFFQCWPQFSNHIENVGLNLVKNLLHLNFKCKMYALKALCNVIEDTLKDENSMNRSINLNKSNDGYEHMSIDSCRDTLIKWMKENDILCAC